MLNLNLSRRAAKVLDKLTKKQYNQLSGKITALLIEPAPPDSSLLKGQASD